MVPYITTEAIRRLPEMYQADAKCCFLLLPEPERSWRQASEARNAALPAQVKQEGSIKLRTYQNPH